MLLASVKGAMIRTMQLPSTSPEQHRQLHERTIVSARQLAINGHNILNFSSNDYLGLAHHPALKTAAIKAIEQHGTGAGASRLVSGNHPLYTPLETAFAEFTGAQACLAFGSGYMANLGVITTIASKPDLILADKLCHASLIDAFKLSGATSKRFRHNDIAHLTDLLRNYRHQYRNCLIVTEGIFSMDGDAADIPALYALAQAHGTTLLVDDAHGIGVIGTDGKGSLARAGLIPGDDLILTGNFAKAFGSYGGFLCASTRMADACINHARTLIYSTALPPATLAASMAALTLLQQQPSLAEQAITHARHFTERLRLPASDAAIVPLIIGGSEEAILASQSLHDAGFLAIAIRPPTVPKGTARLRFTFSALHRRDDIDQLADFIIAQDWYQQSQYCHSV